jgi:hypothetical protein
MILHTCELTSEFLNSYKWKKNDIVCNDICGFTSDFFYSHEKKMILYICGPTNGFLYSHIGEKKWLKNKKTHTTKKNPPKP